jgi:hypothetical protein
VEGMGDIWNVISFCWVNVKKRFRF